MAQPLSEGLTCRRYYLFYMYNSGTTPCSVHKNTTQYTTRLQRIYNVFHSS
jgi:hypothetical protein